uniref:Transmembrane protein 143 n=1 Tax=Callorhinchus milii TaxID=7868 RepID=A0A4W3IIM9_CALMI
MHALSLRVTLSLSLCLSGSGHAVESALGSEPTPELREGDGTSASEAISQRTGRSEGTEKVCARVRVWACVCRAVRTGVGERHDVREGEYVREGQRESERELTLSHCPSLSRSYRFSLGHSSVTLPLFLSLSLSLSGHGLQTVYEPINPDKDSFPEETVSEGDRQDREWRLLQTLSNMLEQGNFTLLPQETVASILSQPKNTQVVKRFETSVPALYFKRVVMIARLKESHMVLKCFKELPLEALEQTLPSVRPRFSMVDATLLNLMLVGGGIMLFINVGTVLLMDFKLELPHILLLLLVVMGFRWWKAFTEKRAGLTLQLTHILYYKSTSNNRDLLVALSDRACEEQFKELILAQTFLRKPLRQGEKSPEVSSWLHQKSGVKVHFNAHRALANLTHLRGELKKAPVGGRGEGEVGGGGVGGKGNRGSEGGVGGAGE